MKFSIFIDFYIKYVICNLNLLYLCLCILFSFLLSKEKRIHTREKKNKQSFSTSSLAFGCVYNSAKPNCCLAYIVGSLRYGRIESESNFTTQLFSTSSLTFGGGEIGKYIVKLGYKMVLLMYKNFYFISLSFLS